MSERIVLKSEPWFLLERHVHLLEDPNGKRTGVYSTVRLYFDETPGRNKSLAIKKYLRPFQPSIQTDAWREEIRMLQSLRHTNLVEFKGEYGKIELKDSHYESRYVIMPYYKVLLTERIEQGSDDDHQYSMADVKKWTRELLYALQHILPTKRGACRAYLQSLQGGNSAAQIDSTCAAHGTLHPENIAIQGDKLVLLNFGKPVYFPTRPLSDKTGPTAAFEMHVLDSQNRPAWTPRIDDKADTWSVGALVYHMVTGVPLLDNNHETMDLVHQMIDLRGRIPPSVLGKISCQRKRRELEHDSVGAQARNFDGILRANMLPHRLIDVNDVGVDLVDFLDKLVNFEPTQRMTFEDALQHPFLRITHPFEVALPPDEDDAKGLISGLLQNEINASHFH